MALRCACSLCLRDALVMMASVIVVKILSELPASASICWPHFGCILSPAAIMHFVSTFRCLPSWGLIVSSFLVLHLFAFAISMHLARLWKAFAHPLFQGRLHGHSTQTQVMCSKTAMATVRCPNSTCMSVTCITDTCIYDQQGELGIEVHETQGSVHCDTCDDRTPSCRSGATFFPQK